MLKKGGRELSQIEHSKTDICLKKSHTFKHVEKGGDTMQGQQGGPT